MAFHRLTVPTYLGGLPAGYDYINNALSGTPAPADGPKGIGTPNAGTYFDAFGEDATSSHANRSNKALAQNCDALDDVVSGEVPVIAEVWGLGGISSLLISDTVFVGKTGLSNSQFNRNRLVAVVNKTDDNQIVVSGAPVEVSLIHDGSSNNVVGVPASGFYTNPTVNFNPAIPGGTDYRLVYGKKSTLVNAIPGKVDPDAFIRTVLRSVVREMFLGGSNWADAVTNPAATVDVQLKKIITDLISTTGQTGAGKIWKGVGPAWQDSTTTAAAQLNSWLNTVVTDLARTNTGNSGAGKLGAELKAVSFTGAPFSLDPKSITGQIGDLLGFANGRLRTRFADVNFAIDDSGYRDEIVFFDSTGGGLSCQLPNPATNKGRRLRFIDVGGGAEAEPLSLYRYTGTNINGHAGNLELTADYGQWEAICDGAGWFVA